MVRIANGGVELRQLVTMFFDPRSNNFKKTDDLPGSDLHTHLMSDRRSQIADHITLNLQSAICNCYMPQRSPGVRTGASHNVVSSSSMRSSVIEQPAISSDVI